jgi:hypothetical protein
VVRTPPSLRTVVLVLPVTWRTRATLTRSDEPPHRMVDAGEPMPRQQILEDPLHWKPRSPSLSDRLQARITQARRAAVPLRRSRGAGGGGCFCSGAVVGPGVHGGGIGRVAVLRRPGVRGGCFAAARCRWTVARSSPGSRAIRRLDQPRTCSASIEVRSFTLSRSIAPMLFPHGNPRDEFPTSKVAAFAHKLTTAPCPAGLKPRGRREPGAGPAAPSK